MDAFIKYQTFQGEYDTRIVFYPTFDESVPDSPFGLTGVMNCKRKNKNNNIKGLNND
jgi:hypothetical protein